MTDSEKENATHLGNVEVPLKDWVKQIATEAAERAVDRLERSGVLADMKRDMYGENGNPGMKADVRDIKKDVQLILKQEEKESSFLRGLVSPVIAALITAAIFYFFNPPVQSVEAKPNPTQTVATATETGAK